MMEADLKKESKPSVKELGGCFERKRERKMEDGRWKECLKSSR